jgi:hypothetical protein
MNTDALLLNKIFANLIQQYIHHEQNDFIPDMQGWTNVYKSVNITQHTNRIKDKNRIITSIEVEKALASLHYKSLEETRNIKNIPQNNKGIYYKPISNIY